jgi:N5-(cytidine 5'-diphosphoramidyl)-L-glutamine hydrolase
MKKIGITQREENIYGKNEMHDALDQRWMDLLFACQLEPLLLPNHLPTIERYLANHRLDGLILSGGNDVHCAPRRDLVERRLLEWAYQHKIPLLGVCRGMQMLQVFFGQVLVNISNHVNTVHLTYFADSARSTNSFHLFGIMQVPDQFMVLAQCSDGTIESMRHKDLPWYGIMWHPEREPIFLQEDLDLIKEIFK